MPLSFRHRVFLGLVGLGTLPLAIVLVVLALQMRSTGSPAGLRATLDELSGSGRETIAAIDTMALSDTARAALRSHLETIAQSTTLARRAETLTRSAAGLLAVSVVIAAVVVILISLTTARRLSAYTSAPIEELVQWVGRIEQREPLPSPSDRGGAPEFDALRRALRTMADALEQGRRQAVERERLAAFRETARHVAHEMRGPLTAARLAIRQLGKSPEADQRAADALTVLADEAERLEQMAREFSEFGRLPEGPEAPVDVAELLEGVLATTVPESCPVTRDIATGLEVRAHYEPLRRAVQNLVSNAVEATDERGITVIAEGKPEAHTVVIRIADHGPGVPDDQRDRIFEPYVTTKQGGIGLGLALAKQTVVAHGGTLRIETAEGAGASFVMELPVHA